MVKFIRSDNQNGFTLLEVLIAIGITALIGLGTWQLMGGTIRAQNITQNNSERFEKLQKLMLILSRDLQQLTTRPIRDEYGDVQPALSNRNQLYLVEFTRAGWRNPMGDARSDLQRVAYELVDGELLRHYWTVLDRAQDSESVFQVLMDDVDTISLRFMKSDNQWIDSWPEEQAADAGTNIENNLLPKAVEITIEHHYFGSLVRLYDTPQYINLSVSGTGTGGGSGSGTNGNGSGNGSNSNQVEDSQQDSSKEEAN